MLEIRQPSRRMIMPAEVAQLGLFLCSDEAANVSGADMPIDGVWGVIWFRRRTGSALMRS